MEAVVTIFEVIDGLLPAAFTAAIGWLAMTGNKRKERLTRMSSRQDAIADGVKAILRQHIVDAYECYITNGAPLTVERFNELNAQHEAYKGLEGNGVVDQMWDALLHKGIHVVPTDYPLYSDQGGE